MIFAQYSNASNLSNLLYGTDEYVGFNSYLNIDWRDFYNNFFNIRTANSQGLDNWGIIFGITRNIYLIDEQDIFGFDYGSDSDPDYPQSFNYGGFYSGNAKFTALPDDEFRAIILLRYRTLTSNMSIINITNILNQFFIDLGDTNQKVSVQDNIEKMSITYTFSETLQEWQTIIFTNNPNNINFLPRPLGVRTNIITP